MDRPKNARVVGFVIFGVAALILLPLLFSDPVDPRSTIRSRFSQGEGETVVVARDVRITPEPTQASAPAARPVLPVGEPARASRPDPVRSEPTARPLVTPPPREITRPRTTPVVKPTLGVADDASKPAWRMQLASYTDQASAERFVKRLREDGLEPRMIGAQSGARRVWRVSVEFRASRADAQALKQKIDQRYGISALLQAR